MFKLYLKEHLITGIKYLGQTKRDPLKYLGSGIYWKRHLKKHGNHVKTTILGEYLTKDEVKKAGLYYSSLWDIVNNPLFANLMPESGNGQLDPRLSEKYQEAWAEGKFSVKGDKNPNFGKQCSDYERQRMREGWEVRLSSGIHAPWNKGLEYTEEMKEKLKVPRPNSKGKKQSEEHVAKRMESKRITMLDRPHGFLGKNHSEDTKQLQREAALSRPKIECEYCLKIVSVNIYPRFHGERCKFKKGD